MSSTNPAVTVVNQDDVAKEAYKIYLARNGEPGDPTADWFEAENIVRARSGARREELANAAARVTTPIPTAAPVMSPDQEPLPEPMAPTKAGRAAAEKAAAAKAAKSAEAAAGTKGGKSKKR